MVFYMTLDLQGRLKNLAGFDTSELMATEPGTHENPNYGNYMSFPGWKQGRAIYQLDMPRLTIREKELVTYVPIGLARLISEQDVKRVKANLSRRPFIDGIGPFGPYRSYIIGVDSKIIHEFQHDRFQYDRFTISTPNEQECGKVFTWIGLLN